MMLRLAVRGVSVRPVRSLVLASGFGLGIAVMAALLGVGQVALVQSGSPHLDGGGDAILRGWTGGVPSARFLMRAVLGQPPLSHEVLVAAPSRSATLYLVGAHGVTGVRARGTVPGLDRALGDPEISQVPGWTDVGGDRAWTRPEASDVLRAMDRFHAPPASSRWADSWAEWLYFNGRSADGQSRFFLSFMAGPAREGVVREAGVRLQLSRAGVARAFVTRTFSSRGEVDARSLLESAPDLDVAGGSVRLAGTRYELRLDLPAEDGKGRARGTLVLAAPSLRSLPPLELHGLDGWESGYAVPVLSGALSGEIEAGADIVSFEGGTGYHDHNWGSWAGVTWQWGQVSGDELSLVWGRVVPPPEAADPQLVPALLAAHGPTGPLALTRRVAIQEEDEGGRPVRILVRAEGAEVSLDVTLEELEVAAASRAGDAAVAFLQLSARARVRGRLGGREVDFVGPASAETFRAEATCGR